jgi:streptogramin lyase
VKYDLKTGKKAAAFAAREARQLNDVAVAPNGDVYASDSASGAVFRLDVKEGKFEVEWGRQPDGQWLIRNMSTRSAPPK